MYFIHCTYCTFEILSISLHHQINHNKTKNNIMKTNKLYRNVVIFIITVSTALILLAAQINYKAAINAACKTDCSDMQIELAMKNYGFNVDANQIIEPSMVAKIKALFN